ncbi:MAG TPA: methyltransferase domain-containing protein [Thermoanaerobaculia bacterium]|nr:methyltransferase domain-containing protein [Thermoanaerobaculia bacterium]
MSPLRQAAHWFHGRSSRPAAVDWVPLGSLAALREHQSAAAPEIRRRRAFERALMTCGDRFTVPGHCWICQRPSEFQVDYSYSYPVDGVLTPNWREHLLCPGCCLNNRMRATIHFFEERVAPPPGAAIYLTEQTTALFRYLRERHPNAMGSEYLGHAIGFGEQNAAGIRNESVTCLTFADASFDAVISLDVFEHVPELQRALAECHRVLRPGGSLLFSVPFQQEHQENLVRAVVDGNGEIRHLLPPEYHGDPLHSEGCLAFYCFGWELLDQVRAAGFAEVNAYSFWSRDLGYLGSPLILFLARRKAA